MAVVEATRRGPGDLGGKVGVERRHFITSPRGRDTGRIVKMIRGHWGVEGRPHWRPGMSFG